MAAGKFPGQGERGEERGQAEPVAGVAAGRRGGLCYTGCG